MTDETQAEKREALAAEIEAAGFPKQAAQIRSITPEQEAAFDQWLQDPANRKRWDDALAGASR